MEADLERAIALDEDERDLEPTGRTRSWSCPGPSNRCTCASTGRWSSSSKPGGKGHITRMHAVLRAYVDAQIRRAGG